MPYIKQERREIYDADIKSLTDKLWHTSPGEMTYVIYKLLKTVYGFEEADFPTRSDAMGILECVKSEFYRKVLVPYEEGKIKSNGAV